MYSLDLGNLLVHLRLDARQWDMAFNTAAARIGRVADKLGALGTGLTMRVTAPLALVGGAAVKEFARFDDAMTKSLAIMSDVTPQLRQEMEALATTISERSWNGFGKGNSSMPLGLSGRFPQRSGSKSNPPVHF